MRLVSGMTLAGAGLATLIGAFFGAAGLTFTYAEGTSYLSDDPRACVNCHIMREQYDGWQKASHHAHATCNDCHVPHDLIGKYATKVEHGYRHSRGFTFNDFHEPIRITPRDRVIAAENCVRCHAPMVDGIAHGLGGPLDCTRCHANVGHGPTW